MSHVVSAHAYGKTLYPRTLEICVGAGILVHVLVFVLFPPMEVAPFRLAEPPPPPFEVIEYRIPQKAKLPILPADPTPPDLAALDDQLRSVAEIVPVLPTEAAEDPVGTPAVPGDPGAVPPFQAEERKPALLKSVVPDYPALAREAGAEGTVIVEAWVDRSGRVADARVVDSDTVPSLNRAALEAAYRFLFAPARQRHTAVPVRVTIPFTFTLY
jgi:protein TonB